MTDQQNTPPAVVELDAALAEIGGCGDGACIIVKPKGMHTNGGCRCSRDWLKMQRFAYAHNRFAAAHRIAAERTARPDVVALVERLQAEVDFFQRNRLRGEKSSTEALLLEAIVALSPQTASDDAAGEKLRTLRDAVAASHLFAVLTLAFIGRDRGTDRFENAINGIVEEARKVDALTRAALAQGEAS